ncbi:MAG: lytic murein transglycosylase [Pseudomonadota bacterium]|nr:lytic murein transglycosylase [Pseudomonadota bacterium]
MKWYGIALVCFCLAGCAAGGVPAEKPASPDFASWLAGVKAEALEGGISAPVVHEALDDLQPIPRVLELDRRQPESTMTLEQYLRNVLPESRIAEGQRLLQVYADTLDQVEKRYDIPRELVVALWGMESSFGQKTGDFGVIPALATLAWDGRRSVYFRKELMKALKIADEKHIPLSQMKGSWAGAMGQSQFMPSSFLAYAVDQNGDGHRDIWQTEADVFASAANYMAKAGWKNGQFWGQEVLMPEGFSAAHITLDEKKTLDEWSALGVRDLQGQPLQGHIKASLVAPDGLKGRTFLVEGNYRAIMAWNRSTYFATAVGLLSDRLSDRHEGDNQ